MAFLARDDKRVDKRSGVSQRLPIACLEAAISSAEQRAARNHEAHAAARIVDVYAAIPAMTGKLELEYEGELKGADAIARELIRAAVGKVFTKHLGDANFQPVVQWFELGGELKVPENASAIEQLAALRSIQGLLEHVDRLGANGKSDAAAHRRRRRIHSRRPLGPQARQPQRRARLLRRRAQARSRAARAGPNRPPRRQYN